MRTPGFTAEARVMAEAGMQSGAYVVEACHRRSPFPGVPPPPHDILSNSPTEERTDP
jgi:hypothetical protein